MEPAIRALCERVRTAAAAGQALRIRGGGTKDFYGNSPVGELLELQELRGVVAYEPSELVVTARGGTPLAQLEQLLADQQQMLAFEPPHFGAAATVGGCVAAGLAGPRRAANGYARGGVRDFLLGAKLIDGRGQLLAFGGTVMKNVAGFDVARLLAGSLGILGVIAEVSVKVLPMPAAQKTLRFALNEAAALTQLQNWQMLPLPISASCWLDGQLTIRLSGARAAVAAARSNLGGELLDEVGFWTDVREQQLDYFGGNSPLWRISLPATAPALNLTGSQLIEWGGALRWLRSPLPADTIREHARLSGGHATLFRGGERSAGVFSPLAPALAAIHRRLKAEFDPCGIFNPGRMYADL